MNITVCPIYTMLKSTDDPPIPNIVIDTLRMTSVAVTALANGCCGLAVVEEPEQARELAHKNNALLGGERHAVRIPGFDLTNSPLEYTQEKISGHRIVTTTTNGTRAVLAARSYGPVFLGSLLNRNAVAETLYGYDAVRFVLAGSNGGFSLEDTITAGAIISRLGGEENDLDDCAMAALLLYRETCSDFHNALCHVAHYRYLQKIGYQADLNWCLREDVFTCVPRLSDDGWFYTL